MIEVVAPGIASTIQDRGRPGLARLGVVASGAVDIELASLANRLVGNPPEAAVIETCGGLVIRAVTAVVIATTVEAAPISLGAGSEYRMPHSVTRLWHYLAVRGGLDVAPTLGSRATDTLAGLGGDVLAEGARYAIGPDPGTPITTDQVPLGRPVDTATVTPGPRLDWFAPGSFERLTSTRLTVTTSSRVGVRLSGVALDRARTGELPSEGLVRGAIQVPPDGNPVMMLADHPTTGGYPVIAVVDDACVAVVAQTRPGATLRLLPG